VLLFVGGTLLLVEEGGRGRDEGLPPGSVFDESPEGLALAYRYLGERPGAAPGVLQKRIGHERPPADAVVFRVKPLVHPVALPPEETRESDDDHETAAEGDKKPGKRSGRPRDEAARESGGEGSSRARRAEPRLPLLSPAEEDWVRGGGRLVLATDTGYGPLGIGLARAAEGVVKTFPAWPGVRALGAPDDRAFLEGVPADEAVTLFARGPRPVVSRLARGRGEVVLLALPGALLNADLGKNDHLKLLLALAGEGRPVLFDEWAHGLGREDGLLEVLLEWGFGPFLVLGGLGFAVWLWRGRSSIGPLEPDPAESRSEAVDLVDSLAQLYDRALSRREAARLYRDSFEAAVAARTGLRGRALAKRAAEIRSTPALASAAGGKDLPPSEFHRQIQSIGDGFRRLHEHVHPRRRL
jgi:hypothetical protein